MMTTDKKLYANSLGCMRHSRILFKDLSFKVSLGETLLVEGPNGCGKSSLLRLIAGLATPAWGEIFWEEKAILRQPSAYQNHLHYLGHRHGIKIGLTVWENLAYMRSLSLYEVENDTLLSRFQLSEYKHIQAKYLSAGQKRRLALLKLLLIPRTLWILDEPMTALDRESQTLFLACLIKHVREGGMAVISSHHALEVKEIPISTLRWTV